jgi:hypothetical protein
VVAGPDLNLDPVMKPEAILVATAGYLQPTRIPQPAPPVRVTFYDYCINMIVIMYKEPYRNLKPTRSRRTSRSTVRVPTR